MVGLLLVVFGILVAVFFDPVVNSFIFKVCNHLGYFNCIGFLSFCVDISVTVLTILRLHVMLYRYHKLYTFTFFYLHLESNVIFFSQELIIRNNTDMYEKWKEPPVVPHLQVYFFNISNKEEYLEGDKPVLQEVGPYCYRWGLVWLTLCY